VIEEIRLDYGIVVEKKDIFRISREHMAKACVITSGESEVSPGLQHLHSWDASLDPGF
jgi:hypothetical protein